MSAIIIRDYASLDRLRNDWERLAMPFNNPLLGFDWFHTCAHTLHSETDLHIVILSDSAGTICGIAPLVKVRSGKTEWLQVLGASTLYEPTGFLYRKTSDLTRLFRLLERQPHPVLLSRMWEMDNAGCLPKQGPYLRGLWIRRNCAGSAVLDIKTDWESFYQSISTQRRYDYRRAARRASTYGDMHFSATLPGLESLDQGLDIAFKIENNSWKGKQGSSILSRPELRDFLAHYARSSAASGSLRLFLLFLGDIPVAMAICVQHGNILWFLKIGYDANYRTCSPGMLLMMHAVGYCFDNDLSRIEFLGSHEPWLSTWTKEIRAYTSLLHYPASISGIRNFTGDCFRSIIARTLPGNQTNG